MENNFYDTNQNNNQNNNEQQDSQNTYQPPIQNQPPVENQQNTQNPYQPPIQNQPPVQNQYNPNTQYQGIPNNYQSQQPTKNNGLATASLVLGIVSLVFSLFFGSLAWLGTITGIVGIILGAISIKKYGKSNFATAGLIMSVISVALSIIIVIACVACMASFSSLYF